MKNFHSFFTLATAVLFAVVFTGCSKEKKLERTLHKKDGEWNISSVTWQKVEQSGSGQNVTMGTTTNAGKFVFDKDGSGSYNFTVDGDTYSQSFNWSVSEDAISVAKTSQTVDFSGNFTQLAIAISGEQTGKNKIRLEGSETLQYSSGSITQKVITGTFELSK